MTQVCLKHNSIFRPTPNGEVKFFYKMSYLQYGTKEKQLFTTGFTCWWWCLSGTVMEETKGLALPSLWSSSLGSRDQQKELAAQRSSLRFSWDDAQSMALGYDITFLSLGDSIHSFLCWLPTDSHTWAAEMYSTF